MLVLTDIIVIASGVMLGCLGFYAAYIVGNKIAERIERGNR